MAQETKILVTEEGTFDLAAYRWDDRLFSDLLSRERPIDSDQAMDISRSLREEIGKMELHTITIPMLEKIIEAKLLEYGFTKGCPIKLDTSMFKKEELLLSKNARTVLDRRYLKKDSKGRVQEKPEEMFRRVARHIAKAEERYGDDAHVKKMEELFYELMTTFKFLPNSPTLMNAGRRLGQLAACFVLPVEDSMEGIFDALRNAALIHKSGGGTGFSFSRLRPKSSRVGTTGGIASGPVSFMKIFNTATEQVKQGGTRRGANMAILRVDHPDIMEFIYCKKNKNELNNFNISVGITDAFMEAVNKDRSYDLVDPRDNRKAGTLDAGQVYHALVHQAWEAGDPGVIFYDRMNRDNPTPAIGEIESTNPCGEQPLLPLEACNLGSINLAKFVIEKDGEATIDYEALKETAWLSVRFLDDVIDMSKYPLPEIERRVRGNRKIGLGVMGFADILYHMKIPYHSEEALGLAEEMMAFIQKESSEASGSLAEERGAFENFDKSIFKERENGRFRNATTTTIAPTGTLSIIAGCSSGIEPLFALSFVRRVMDNDELLEVNPYFEKVARERGFYSRELMNTVASAGSIRDIENIPEDVKEVFVTAHDVTPEWHVRMQAAFQKYTDNAVSKTVNLPRDATVGDVLQVYKLAFELGCKGVTIYRDGSKEAQPLSTGRSAVGAADSVLAPRKRSKVTTGITERVTTGCGYIYVTVNSDEEGICEVFSHLGKSGGCAAAQLEATCRLISLALRSGIEVAAVVRQLRGIRCPSIAWEEGKAVLSCADAIASVLERHIDSNKSDKGNGGGAKTATDYGIVRNIAGQCPDCSSTLVFQEGCFICPGCGYTKC